MTMNRNILEEFYSDPAIYRNVVANANRERCRALSADFAWLAEFIQSRFTLLAGIRPAHWLERAG